MSRWAKLKIIIGAIVGIFLVLIIALIINISHFVNSEYEKPNINEQVKNNKQIVNNNLNMDNDTLLIMDEVAKKNGNWSNLPISKSFKKKFNSKDGIFMDDNYTYCGLFTDSSFDKLKQIVCYNVWHNYKAEWYYVHYILNGQNELDDVEIFDKVLKQDEKGNPVIYKKSMSEEYYLHNLIGLAFPYRLEYDIFEYVNVTDDYLNKWKEGFVVGAPIFSIESIEPLCNYNNQLAYLKCEYPEYDENDDIIGMDEEKDLYYRVHYFVDNNMWLDDVEVEEVSKEEIDRLLSEKEKESNP